jgi:hypothetical protein
MNKSEKNKIVDGQNKKEVLAKKDFLKSLTEATRIIEKKKQGEGKRKTSG